MKTKPVPKEVLNIDDFLFLDEMLLEIGYKKIPTPNNVKDFIQSTISGSSIRIAGVSYCSISSNDFASIINIAFSEKEKRWKHYGDAYCWVLISKDGIAKYFARPFKKTSSELIWRVLRYAWITKFKVDHRPKCSICNKLMDIRRKPGTRQYFWICWNKDIHPKNKPESLEWDYGLGSKAKAFLEIRRDLTDKYKTKNKKLGKDPTPAAKIRKFWQGLNKK